MGVWEILLIAVGLSMDAFAEENRTVLPVRELLKKAASAILPLYESRGIALAVQSEEFSLAENESSPGANGMK